VIVGDDEVDEVVVADDATILRSCNKYLPVNIVGFGFFITVALFSLTFCCCFSSTTFFCRFVDSFASGALNSVLARQSANLCLYNSTVTGIEEPEKHVLFSCSTASMAVVLVLKSANALFFILLKILLFVQLFQEINTQHLNKYVLELVLQ